MTVHYWGDPWFQENGNEFNKAMNWIEDKWTRWGRIGSHSKEKYGRFDQYVYFYTANWAISELTHPGCVYYPRHKSLLRLEVFLGKAVRMVGLRRLINRWQSHVYNATMQVAVKKWPQFYDELLCDAEYNHIWPSIWGPLDGKILEDEFWTGTQ